MSIAAAAQDIHYTLQTRDSNCNGFNDGRAVVNVTQLHPPYTFLWSTGSADHIVNDLAPGTYSVTVTDSTGNDTLISVAIGERTCDIAAKLAFTPNADGINDTWTIASLEYYPDNLILVFNRWGQKVYEHSGAYTDPWDGRDLLGIPVPDNAYFYIIYGDKKDEKSIVKGNVSIIR
jgi:gliding motility-associated-like protein